MSLTMHVPELGEDVDSVDVIAVLVAPGDTIAKGQAVIEVETEKASVEVPAEADGEVTELHVAVGDTIGAGAPILTMNEVAEAATPAPEPAPPDAQEDSQPQKPVAEPSKKVESTERDVPAAAPAATHRAPAWAAPPEPPKLVPAAPSVRRFAREIGVDIADVKGSGPGGRLSIDDVKAYAQQVLSGPGVGAHHAAPPLPDFSRWGSAREEKASKVRRVTAERMARAWHTVAAVTNHDRADITRLEEARKKYRDRVAQQGGQLTLTAILVKVIASALKVFPDLNSSLDSERGVIIRKDYVHIGVAVDTEHGLLVPVIRDADRKNVAVIARELTELAEKARARKLLPTEMEGGTFSISNLGGIGGTGFSPIVNWPEVAILGVSRGRMEPLWNGTDFEPRLMVPLSLSYDHRLIDGATAARFLRWTAEALEEPILLSLEG